MAGLKKVREYLKATGAEDLQVKVIEQMVVGMVNSGKMGKIEGKKMLDLMTGMTRRITRKAMRIMCDIFRESLTTKEINYLISVQNHPITIKLRDMMPQISMKMMPNMMKIVDDEAERMTKGMFTKRKAKKMINVIKKL